MNILTKRARELRDTGVETSRQTAAEVLKKTGRQMKRQSKKASHFIEERGVQLGSTLESRAGRIRGGRHPALLRYFSSHPIEGILFAGLALAIICAFVLPVLTRGREAEDDDYFAVP